LGEKAAKTTTTNWRKVVVFRFSGDGGRVCRRRVSSQDWRRWQEYCCAAAILAIKAVQSKDKKIKRTRQALSLQKPVCD
jgi:hypothetical protein